MTVGELATLFNAERKIDADLTVIPCEGWRRGDLYDQTGLLWVNPSPNMRSLTEALLYPGVGLLESTNLATGRGTDTPFERVGAPWIDPVAFSNALNARGLPGVRFTPIRFSPTERQYKGEDCGGVYHRHHRPKPARSAGTWPRTGGYAPQALSRTVATKGLPPHARRSRRV